MPADDYRGSFDQYVYERRRRQAEERLIRREDVDLKPQPKEIRHRPEPGSSPLTLKWEEPKVEPFKRLEPKIIGSLFDRLRFLEERIIETQKNIQSRETIHQTILKDIDVDVGEKEEMIARSVDADDRRNLKMDISVLRREKRNESVQYWRDIVELGTELRELMEQQISEKKIVDIFRELDEQAGGEK